MYAVSGGMCASEVYRARCSIRRLVFGCRAGQTGAGTEDGGVKIEAVEAAEVDVSNDSDFGVRVIGAEAGRVTEGLDG